MPSIVVKYHPRTGKRSPRFSATSNTGLRTSVDITQYSTGMEAEKAAVSTCITKMGWADGNISVWHRSGMTQMHNCVAVYVWPNDTYRVKYDARESYCCTLERQDTSRAYSEEDK